jgi:hypothetical protein
MYTLEINGTALVVTNADEGDARALLESEDFKADLKTLTAEGRPLWDGAAPMTIREASAEEIEVFEEALSEDDDEDQDEDDTDDEPIDLVFLVEVDEDEDDDDEDDNEGGAASA